MKNAALINCRLSGQRWYMTESIYKHPCSAQVSPPTEEQACGLISQQLMKALNKSSHLLVCFHCSWQLLKTPFNNFNINKDITHHYKSGNIWINFSSPCGASLICLSKWKVVVWPASRRESYIQLTNQTDTAISFQPITEPRCFVAHYVICDFVLKEKNIIFI